MRRPLFPFHRRRDDLDEVVAAFVAAEWAEDDGADGRAAEALERLFAALPAEPVPAGFARRVARVALGVPAATLAWPWLAAGVAAGFALAAGVVALAIAAGIVDPGAAFASAASTWVALGTRLGPAIDVVRLVVQVRHAVVVGLTGTAVGPGLLAALVASAFALYRLTLPPASSRSSAYV